MFFVHLVSQQHEGLEIDLVRFVCMLRRSFSGAGDGPLFLDVCVLSPSMRVRMWFVFDEERVDHVRVLCGM